MGHCWWCRLGTNNYLKLINNRETLKKGMLSRKWHGTFRWYLVTLGQFSTSPFEKAQALRTEQCCQSLHAGHWLAWLSLCPEMVFSYNEVSQPDVITTNSQHYRLWGNWGKQHSRKPKLNGPWQMWWSTIKVCQRGARGFFNIARGLISTLTQIPPVQRQNGDISRMILILILT